ncbi:ABC transporter ATP-binding protein [Elusimicrobiota bacterium]
MAADENKIIDIYGLSIMYYSDGAAIQAVRGVDITLEKGECVGIVGESGCGKSTLALAVLRLINKAEGKITDGKIGLKGKDLREITDEEMRKIRGNQISMILQDPFNSLNPVINIREQLREAYFVHNPEVKEMEKVDKIIQEGLKEVQLPSNESFLNSYPHQLSGGMLQRVSIAAALINSPEVLIADEPTSNLDVTIQKQIMETLKNLKEIHNLSMIFITHDLNLVSSFADTIYILYAGKVMEYGPVSDIFNDPAHPYTKGLLKALPRLGEKERIYPIPGNVPHPSDLPPGCSFAPRCGLAGEECKAEGIEMVEVGSGHYARCIKINDDK